ncbi:hypothetical protein RUM43_000247 [Polyplax serrata]|uniref:Uncharacterized protein n=1 Tax=Polyplax serrata TaxID=468196 RepID=A0AAN8SCJ5_POLSC
MASYLKHVKILRRSDQKRNFKLPSSANPVKIPFKQQVLRSNNGINKQNRHYLSQLPPPANVLVSTVGPYLGEETEAESWQCHLQFWHSGTMTGVARVPQESSSWCSTHRRSLPIS